MEMVSLKVISGHHCDLLLDGLELSDRAAELGALLGVAGGHVKNGLHRADHLRASKERAASVQCKRIKTSPSLADVIFRDRGIAKNDSAGWLAGNVLG